MRKIYILFAILLLASCKQTQTIVEKPVYIHDTTTTVKEIHDSTYIDRWHTIQIKGDTIFITDSVYIVKWHVKTDTAYKYIEKPVTVTLEKVKEVKKPVCWIVKVLAWLGGFSILVPIGIWAWDKWIKKND